MKKYFIEFCKRGLAFGIGGPVVVGFVYMILDFCGTDLYFAGWQILLAIVTSYILAFVQAGSSVFEQIEEWSALKSMFIHLLSIYAVYVFTYLVNSWIPFNWYVLVIFSAAVIVGFFIIWASIYFASNVTKNRLNRKLGQ